MSSRYEGLSLALLEASSMGLPSVVTDVGGNAEVVIDGATGYVIEAGDPRRLAEAMRKLLNAPAEARRRFGVAAREHCVAKFHLETVMEKWIQLYGRYMSVQHVAADRLTS